MEISTTKKEYYKVLNVPVGATRLEIRESYLRLKNAYDPNGAAHYSIMDSDDASQMLAKIEEAYQNLNNESSRPMYQSNSSVNDDWRQGASAEASLESFGNLDFSYDDSPGSYKDRGDVFKRHPSIKIKATQAGSPGLLEKFEELTSASDPGDGDLFRQLRELANVNIDEIQERTKVCVSYIQAIEENRFERLPQLVYVKGFIKSILKYLGVPNAETYVEAYAARLKEWQTTQELH